MSEKVDEAELDKLVREQLELLKLENEDERRNNVDDLKQGGSLNDLVLKDLHEFDIDRIEVEFGKEEDAKLKHMLSIGSNVICCSKGENGEWAENGVVSNIEPNRIFVLIRQNCASQIQAIKEKFTVKTFHNDFTFRCMKRYIIYIFLLVPYTINIIHFFFRVMLFYYLSIINIQIFLCAV